MNRFVAMLGLVAGAVATAATPAAPLNAPAVPGTLAAIDRTVYRCDCVEQGTECRRRGDPAERIAGEAISEIMLLYRSGVLVRTMYAFSEAEFDALANELTATFGSPQPGRELLQAGMAGVFENRYYIWRRGDQVWFAEQFYERVTTSGLWHMTTSEFAALLAERDRARVHGARDL